MAAVVATSLMLVSWRAPRTYPAASARWPPERPVHCARYRYAPPGPYSSRWPGLGKGGPSPFSTMAWRCARSEPAEANLGEHVVGAGPGGGAVPGQAPALLAGRALADADAYQRSALRHGAWLSLAYTHAGNLDQAVAVGRRTLTRLASVSSVRSIGLLRRLRHDLAPSAHRDPAVRELAIVTTVASGGTVETGIGKFVPADRKATTARNPQTGETVPVSAKRVPAFRAAKAFKDAVAGV
ncbi:HU family DNA-binding protein [Sphaerisporangium sp. NBC_01403]|uniref:HU family DNA-binding protein n=1 Tax=Sphaerisporangium sp. NBC_01403 TaxID=2903599 RepID=UPI003865A86C